MRTTAPSSLPLCHCWINCEMLAPAEDQGGSVIDTGWWVSLSIGWQFTVFSHTHTFLSSGAFNQKHWSRNTIQTACLSLRHRSRSVFSSQETDRNESIHRWGTGHGHATNSCTLRGIRNYVARITQSFFLLVKFSDFLCCCHICRSKCLFVCAVVVLVVSYFI